MKALIWKNCDGTWYCNDNELVIKGLTRYNEKDFIKWLVNEVDFFNVDNNGYHLSDNNIKIDFRNFDGFLKAISELGIVQEIKEIKNENINQ